MGVQDGVRWPPAWYADPLARHDHRWWDGAAWTAHVADAGVAGTDPIDAHAMPAVGAATPMPSTFAAPRGAGVAVPTGGRDQPMAIAAMVVGLVALPLAFVPFVGLAAAVTGLTLALVARSRIRRDATGGGRLAVTGLVASIGALLLSLVITLTAIAVLSGLGGGLSEAFSEYVACLEVRSEEECRALLEATMLRSLG